WLAARRVVLRRAQHCVVVPVPFLRKVDLRRAQRCLDCAWVVPGSCAARSSVVLT
ncbi:hypothetical protein A2U01_0058728, partial [Trifolium medium]|nr:hypothetical protein [Trifolium medium]